ncbi:MAG TPA: TA system VapC family ribonuclease toxin [Acidimicrobiales bacterium]|nr:TA system VapC family ribonuclease toxin [Acidimicrobiales bacterium]
MTDRLLDPNLLIALVVGDHVHHTLAEEWFIRDGEPFATSPTTQGALVRFLIRHGATAAEAIAVLRGVTGNERHRFWPDDNTYDIDLAGVIGPRQVTDAYLAYLARAHDARLVTLDKTVAALHPDVADLVGTR